MEQYLKRVFILTKSFSPSIGDIVYFFHIPSFIVYAAQSFCAFRKKKVNEIHSKKFIWKIKIGQGSEGGSWSNERGSGPLRPPTQWGTWALSGLWSEHLIDK